MSYFTGKKVLVTGGSRGIGRAMALQLASQGADVAIWARNQDALDDTVDAMRATAASPEQTFLAQSVDVVDRAVIKTCAAILLEELGGLDVLINNSGYARPLPLDELSDDDIDGMTQINYMGHVNVTRAFLGHFREQKSGDICNITSMLGFMGFYGYTAYCGSKYAIAGFSEGLRQEMMLYNVRVSVFYPPTTDTPGLKTENSVKPQATWAIEGKSTQFSSEDVGAAVLKSIRKGRFTNMVGLSNWGIYYAHRYAPGFVRWVMDRALKKQQKSLESS